MSITVVHVVVPAHDEEEHIGPCLAGVEHAVTLLRAARPDVAVTTTVVLDRCTDRTLARTVGHDWSVPLRVLPVDAGSVGAARRAGVDDALACHPADPTSTWIACTDADSQVPASWLVDHLDLARSHDLVVGRVRPDAADLSSPALVEWERRHTTGDLHVHGANLGVRASTYLAVGGFAPVDQHEDVLLAEAAMAAGARWTQATLVATSGRLVGRTPGGFSGYLRDLEREVG